MDHMRELEEEIIKNIDESYFEIEDTFKPFDKLVEIFSSDVNEEEEKEKGGGIEHEESNHSKLDVVQKQAELCTRVIDNITREHQASLIQSTQEMSSVYGHYIEMRKSIANMRNEIAESQSLLLSCSQLDKEQQLFHSKTQNGHVLELVNVLELVHDAPRRCDELIEQKRFVSAADLLNTSLHHIFSTDLVNVEAIGRIRFDLVERKGFVLDDLVSELAKALFHYTTTTIDESAGNLLKSQSGSSSFMQEHAQERMNSRSFARGGNLSHSIEYYDSNFRNATLESAEFVDVDTENGLKDPSADRNLYIKLLVEAIFRLGIIHDAERHLSERIKDGIECISAGLNYFYHIYPVVECCIVPYKQQKSNNDMKKLTTTRFFLNLKIIGNMKTCGAVLDDFQNQEDMGNGSNRSE